MVIHEDSEIPVEVSVIRKPLFEQKTYVIVKNHVREIAASEENKSIVNHTEKITPGNSENELKLTKGKVKKSQKRKKKDHTSTSSSESDDNTCKMEEISPEDLQELKTVYKKCKAVIKKIETKYAHLLDFEEAHPGGKNTVDCASTDEQECHCTLNKKIVFDDEGKHMTVDPLLDNHICPKKLKLSQTEPSIEHKNIEIEYNDSNIDLPDCLTELYKILQNPEIEITYRNKVIHKARSLRQEYLNDIKFEKHSLIEKMKVNPDELLDFKGANLSVVTGYS